LGGLIPRAKFSGKFLGKIEVLMNMDTEGTVGEIKLFPIGGYDTNYWLPCNGNFYEISDYMALYSLINQKYGGSGQVFEVPKMDSPEGSQYCICAIGTYPGAIS